ncbi:6-carboxyhexanoate-CoA ligase [Loktanella atrilutea]|uniref:6-carboxyhexanoate-CoA ligase n=1 Tax=Loktanella atrilutea TaxID=366533 RepID=A0A1M5A8N2_LOKAT|nr:acetate--CoA ligase family protein [Loktanella atrilutea]SHF26623.1 6-carboxyhexanoate-CoA ligase [Loktanella atrilutea]
MTFDAPRFIRDVFQPESFAIIGASDDPTRIGGRPLAYTRERFAGPIYPVNPTRETVQGLPAYASLADIPGPVDFVLIAVPAARVEHAVRDCAAKGVRCCLIFSSGFAEVGDMAAQARLLDIARPAGLRILGPNCLGLFDAAHGFFPTFTATLDRGLPDGGHVGVVCQSGAYGSHIAYLNRLRGMGVGRMLTTGNESDISVAEGIHALAHDEATGCILAYAEGVRDGPAFREALEAARQNRKPVAIMKVGRSEIGAAAAASHTASLAGEDAVFDAILRQHGAFRARTTDDLIDIAVATRPRIYPTGRRLGIVTISGGAGVLMADAAADHGMAVPPMPQAAQDALRAALPFATPVNPVDVTAQVFNDLPLIRTNMDLMLGQGGYDSIVAFFTSLAGSPSLSGPLRDALAGSLQDHPEALIALSIIAPPAVVADYESAGFIVFEDPSRAVAALAALSDFGAAFARPPLTADVPAAADRLPPGALSEHAAKAVLSAAGLPVLPEALAPDATAAVAAAEGMGYPVVLKVVSAQITHKTEIGGVALNLGDAEAVAMAADGILSRARAAHPDADIDGLLVAPMAPAGVEMILGIQRDPVFGPVVMCGLGGIFAEVLRDVTFRAAPFDLAEAQRMIGELKGQAVLDGVRGRPGGDRAALAQALVALSRFAAAHAEDLETCDINPFVLHDSGGVALDAVILGAG